MEGTETGGISPQTQPNTGTQISIEDLQKQIQALQQALSSLNTQPKSSPRGLKVAPPDPFDGTLSNTETFLSQLILYFAGKKHELPGDLDKITFALSYMKGGTAGPWAKKKVKEFAAVSPKTVDQTWDQFRDEFLSVFGDPDPAGTAREKMEHLKRGNQTADEYIAKFRELKDDTGYNDAVLVDRFEKGLNSALVDKIYALPEMPQTLDCWVLWATRLDRQWRKRETRRKAGGTSPIAKQLTRLSTSTSMPPPRSPAVTQLPQVVPMEVDAGKKNFRSILCYKCRKTGHIARNCPSTVNINSMDFEELKSYMKEVIAKEESPEGFQ
jgi:hypothetical protein